MTWKSLLLGLGLILPCLTLASPALSEDPPEFLYQWGGPGNEGDNFRWLWGGTVGPSGFVYTVDAEWARVQMFDPEGRFVLMWGWGVETGAALFEICSANCQQGISGDGTGQLNGARGIAQNSFGEVFVVDGANHRIQVFELDGSFIEAWGWGVSTGANQYEICDQNCGLGIAGGGEGQFFNPHAVAIDPADDSVLVAGTNMGRVQRFSRDGAYIEVYGPNIDGITLSFCTGVAVDSLRNVYISDLFNDRVVKVSAAGNLVKTWGVAGSGEGEFIQPHGLEVDSTDHIYVTDSQLRVQEFDSDGNFVLMWGDSSMFHDLSELGIDSRDFVFVFDRGSYVKVFGPPGIVHFDSFESGDFGDWIVFQP